MEALPVVAVEAVPVLVEPDVATELLRVGVSLAADDRETTDMGTLTVLPVEAKLLLDAEGYEDTAGRGIVRMPSDVIVVTTAGSDIAGD